MKKMFALSSLMLLCVAVCFAAVTSLNGQWTGTLKTDDGSQYPLNYTFKIDGTKLTGTVKGPHGDLQIMDGEIHGSEFSFTVNLMKMHLLHTGKFYPDSVSMNIECDDAKAHTVLKRATVMASR
jgi:hypothetical protein